MISGGVWYRGAAEHTAEDFEKSSEYAGEVWSRLGGSNSPLRINFQNKNCSPILY